MSDGISPGVWAVGLVAAAVWFQLDNSDLAGIPMIVRILGSIAMILAAMACTAAAWDEAH